MKTVRTPRRGAEYAEAMRTQYRERVKPSKKAYTKSDRKQNKIKFV